MSTDLLDLEQEVAPLTDTAKALTITTPQMAQAVSDTINGWKALKKKIADHYGPLKEKAHAAHKAICTAENAMLAPVDDAIRIAAPKLAAYLQEQERERRRVELAAIEAARKADEEARLAEALAAEQSGETEIANAILELPPTPSPVVVPHVSPPVQGSALRETWEAEVVDLKLLCFAVAEGRVPVQAVAANMTFLNNQARVMKGTFSMPGVRAVKSVGLAKVAGR